MNYAPVLLKRKSREKPRCRLAFWRKTPAVPYLDGRSLFAAFG